MRGIVVWGALACVAAVVGCDDDEPAAASSAASPSTGGGGGGASPVITTVLPNTLPSAGGVPVTVLGANFTSGSQVTIGQQGATPVTSTPPSVLVVTAPRAPAGLGPTVDVNVINPGGAIATLTNGITFVASTVISGSAAIVTSDVDVDGSDIVHLVWQQALASGAVETRVSRSGDGGATWSSSTLLQSTTDPVTRPRIAAGGGDVMAVWGQQVGSVHRITTASSTDGGVTWSPISTLVTTGTQPPDADVALDATGTACIAFRVTGATGPGGTAVDVRASVGAVGGPFSAGITLTGSAESAGPPSVAGDGSGQFVVAYVTGPVGGTTRDLITRRSGTGGSSFAAAVTVAQSSVLGATPDQPAVDLRGSTAICGWLAHGPDPLGPGTVTAVYAASSTDGAVSWPTARLIVPGVTAATRTSLGVAVNGNTHRTVAWGEVRSGYTPEVLSARSTDGGTTWPTLVPRSGTSGASIAPAVAGGSGAMVVHAFADALPGGGTFALKVY